MDIKIPMSEYQRLVKSETILMMIASIVQSEEYVSVNDLKSILKVITLKREGE